MELPATVRLARHSTVFAPARGVRVIGTNPATAVVVEDLAPSLADLLEQLVAPASTRALVDGATARGVPAAVTEDLLRSLHQRGVLVDAAQDDRVIRGRRHGAVDVHGRGPLVAGIVTGLLLAGVGTVNTVTDGTVLAGELGTGLADDDVGRPRAAAVRAAVRRLLPGRTTRPPPRRSVPDLAVLADEPPAPALLADLHLDEVAYLRVALRDGRGLVGPLVLPGRTPCLGCLARHEGDAEPYWPAVTAALAGPGRADPPCAAATAALAVAQALAALDGACASGPPAAALAATLELDLTSATLVRRVWTRHAGCACGGTARSPGRVGETIMG